MLYFEKSKIIKFLSFQDTETLQNLLPHVTKFEEVDNWNHFDFTYSTNASLYTKIIEELKRYELKHFN